VTDSRGNNGGDGVVGNLSVSVSTMVSGVSSMSVSVLSVSLGISFALVHAMMGVSGVMSLDGSVAKMVGGLLAERDILNLFGVYDDDVADVLGGGDAVLSDEDIIDGGTHGSGGVVVGHGGNMVGHGGGVAISVAEAKTVGISRVSVGVGAGGSVGRSQQEGEGENLSVHDCT